MPLSSGTRLGPYGVVAPLGARGMGEAYRARDTRLERDVKAGVSLFDARGNQDLGFRALERIPDERKAAAAVPLGGIQLHQHTTVQRSLSIAGSATFGRI